MPPRPSKFARFRAARAAFGAAAFAPFGVAGLLPTPAHAAPLGTPLRPPKAKTGDVLRLLDDAEVVVVTDDAAAAEAFLAQTNPKQKRVVSVAEWTQTEPAPNRGEVRVFLINREKLPVSGIAAVSAGRWLPPGAADNTELMTASARRVVVRGGRDGCDIVLSAPDGAWLLQDIATFRTGADLPKEMQKRPAPSLLVAPFGAGAENAARFLTQRDGNNDDRPRFHTVSFDEWVDGNLRTQSADEIVLIDRSAGTDNPHLAALCSGKTIAPGDTVAWREEKINGANSASSTGRTKWRTIVSAPNGDLLCAALRENPDPRRVPARFTVLHSARDLRKVRRVVVAGVKNKAVSADLIKQLGSRAATELRSFDTFEVPDRAGLSEVLSEIALQQAGIVQANDRARVQQLAAADALLVVEITKAVGHTDYDGQHDRITPHYKNVKKRPDKPPAPSRLNGTSSTSGKESSPLMRFLTEALLSRALGTKSDKEYDDECSRYERDVLPRYEQELTAYNREKENQVVEWKETVFSQSKITVSGSLRLVDLTDGLVLWETPFSQTQTGEQAEDTKTVTSRGDDSEAPQDGIPPPCERVPDALLFGCAEKAITGAVNDLRVSALLPAPASPAQTGETAAAVTAATPANPATPTGKIVDIDGENYLVGLGETDGVKIGDILTVFVDDAPVQFIVTRVRPRTCDAVWDKKSPAALLGKLSVGQILSRRPLGNLEKPAL